MLPEVPVRQWVLTIPYALRFLLAYDREWIAAVHHVFLNANSAPSGAPGRNS